MKEVRKNYGYRLTAKLDGIRKGLVQKHNRSHVSEA